MEDDNIPLGQYLYSHHAKLMQQQQQKMVQQFYFRHFHPKPIVIPQYRRPSYPTTPNSLLLDTYSDDDEDDEDLVPIAVLQSPQRTQFQSAAEKYKEKVKAQLLYQDDDDDDDELPLSHSKLNSNTT